LTNIVILKILIVPNSICNHCKGDYSLIVLRLLKIQLIVANGFWKCYQSFLLWCTVQFQCCRCEEKNEGVKRGSPRWHFLHLFFFFGHWWRGAFSYSSYVQVTLLSRKNSQQGSLLTLYLLKKKLSLFTCLEPTYHHFSLKETCAAIVLKAELMLLNVFDRI